jgi:hypothetical protein
MLFFPLRQRLEDVDRSRLVRCERRTRGRDPVLSAWRWS